MAVTASVQLESGRIVYARSDFRIRFSPAFQRRHGSYCVKPTRRIRSGLVRVWANASGLVKQARVQESSGPVSGRTQPARYQFPTFTETRFRSSQMSGILLCKTSSDPTYFRLIVSDFGQMDPVWKQANVQESSGPLLANVSQPNRTGRESDPACFLDYFVSESMLRSVSGN